jgi:hypothetical protein
MVRIVLAEEQAKEIRQTKDWVELVDASGAIIGRYFQAFSQAEIQDAKRRSAEEKGGRTTAEVLARLKQLDAK